MVYSVKHLLAAAALLWVCRMARLMNYHFLLLRTHQLAATSCTSNTVYVHTEKEIFQHLHVRNIDTHSSLFCNVIAFCVEKSNTCIYVSKRGIRSTCQKYNQLTYLSCFHWLLSLETSIASIKWSTCQTIIFCIVKISPLRRNVGTFTGWVPTWPVVGRSTFYLSHCIVASLTPFCPLPVHSCIILALLSH